MAHGEHGIDPSRALHSAMRPTGFATPVRLLLPGVIKRIASALQPEQIVLFGSYAYGAPSPDSDVDILVIMRTEASQRDRHLAVTRLLRPRPFPVDIIVRTPEEVQQAVHERDPFICEIMERGEVLYDHSR
jgi:predicted nucleotidyltransferase